MKNVLIAIGIFASSLSAHALECSNGEEVKVVLDRADDGSYSAAVTVQSFGDSYPTYKFRKISLGPIMPGGPAEYEGRGFTLAVRGEEDSIKANLTVPSLDLDRVALTCGKQK